jgi:hypothetical protein
MLSLFGKADSPSSNSSNSSSSSGRAARASRPVAYVRDLKMSLERMRAYEEAIAGVLDRPELELFSAQITAYFVQRDIPLFDYQETYDYLSEMQVEDSTGNPWHWAHVHSAGKGRHWGGGEYRKKPGYHSSDIAKYYELIPIRVLNRIRELREVFGDRLSFYVSRNGHRHRYIMASIDSFIPDPDTIFIFDHWDGNSPEEGDNLPAEGGYSVSS